MTEQPGAGRWSSLPAEEVPADEAFSRDFVLGEELLLREAQDAPAWITGAAYLVTLGILVIWVAVSAGGCATAAQGGPASPI